MQLHTTCHGHCDLETESFRWTDSVKSEVQYNLKKRNVQYIVLCYSAEKCLAVQMEVDVAIAATFPVLLTKLLQH